MKLLTSKPGNTTGRILYGFLFVVLLPAFLIIWARSTQQLVGLPVPLSTAAGIALALCGFTLWITGVATIIKHGDGLPMNAYPPRRYVNRGIYRIYPHPIYAGFTLLCVGIAVAAHSASGFWLVCPFVGLACIALVQGFENRDIAERLGLPAQDHLLQLPPHLDRAPRLSERISVVVLVLGTWLLLYETFVWIGVPPDAINAYLPFESTLPVLQWTELIYASLYLAVAATPFLIRSSRVLRQYSMAALASTAVGIWMFAALPFIAPPRPFDVTSLPGAAMMLDRRLDTAAAAFPSFHAIWAILSAFAFGRSFPRRRYAAYAYAAAVAASCITTGMHALVDVIAGALIGWASIRTAQIWSLLRIAAERVANSYREWNVGFCRIMNHGLYPAAGCLVALLIISSVNGGRNTVAIISVAFSCLICSGLWAQLIEGSPRLLRPYGFYGGLIGCFLGVFVVSAIGGNGWLVLAGYAVAAPIIQASGRLRCLVQGCCHGRKAPETIGIRYVHPASRVTRLTDLGGIPIHPTPLYSILWNLVTFGVVARLWHASAPVQLICGVYLILNGLGRFVEEDYRGEPQTPMIGRLRLYQLTALLSILVGILITMLPASTQLPLPRISPDMILAAIGFAVVVWFTLGVDFPRSNSRFARLR